MNERPILFKPEMVRAILDGSKTQTRRIVDKFKCCKCGKEAKHDHNSFRCDECEMLWPITADWVKSPYGIVGDRLWVREKHQIFIDKDGADWDSIADCDWGTGRNLRVSYPATDGIHEFYDIQKEELSDTCRPSIHMFRWASRINLEIINIKVERLNDISQEDAKSEGVELDPCDHKRQSCKDIGCLGEYVAPFCDLWESIEGQGSWDENPWVFAVEFKLITEKRND